MRAAAPLLDAFIDDALAERALDERDLALVGFSQGTMMSLFVGLRRASLESKFVHWRKHADKLRAGMVASRLVPVEHAIPALTDHLEDDGGVIGSQISLLFCGMRQG